MEGKSLCDLRKDATDTRSKEIMAFLPASASVASIKKRNPAAGEEGAAPSVTITQAFAKVGKKDTERT